MILEQSEFNIISKVQIILMILVYIRLYSLAII